SPPSVLPASLTAKSGRVPRLRLLGMGLSFNNVRRSRRTSKRARTIKLDMMGRGAVQRPVRDAVASGEFHESPLAASASRGHSGKRLYLITPARKKLTSRKRQRRAFAGASGW